MLYPGSAKPLYEQLKDIILDRIHSGELKQGSSVPGERMIADMYKVSRATVRQAIGELVNDGVLYTQHGKGTFVATQKIERPLARLLGVAEEISLEEFDVNIKPIRSGFVDAGSEVLKNLGLSNDNKVYLNCRLITANNQPLFIDYTYVPQAVGHIIDKCDMTRDIFYNILEVCGYKISYAEQTISADSVTTEDAKYLDYTPGRPVLILKRTTYVEGDRPIIYSKTIYRADRYEYKINLKRHK